MNYKNIVEMKNINKSFNAVKAIQDVNFTIGEAEIVGLVGDNAAGKSTLMKILSGVLLPDSGSIYFKGGKVDIKNPRHAREIGIEMVYQELAIFNNLDVKGNIFINREQEVGGIFGSRFMRFILNERKMEKRSVELLNNLKIEIPSTRKLVKQLSGGQRQAVAVARVLLFNAKVIIMDEPTSALAVKEVDKILNIILNIKKTGTSVVLVSHRMDDIFKVADKVVVLRKGICVGERIIKDTNQEEVVSMIVGVNK